jgi:hypothetical protein
MTLKPEDYARAFIDQWLTPSDDDTLVRDAYNLYYFVIESLGMDVDADSLSFDAFFRELETAGLPLTHRDDYLDAQVLGYTLTQTGMDWYEAKVASESWSRKSDMLETELADAVTRVDNLKRELLTELETRVADPGAAPLTLPSAGPVHLATVTDGTGSPVAVYESGTMIWSAAVDGRAVLLSSGDTFEFAPGSITLTLE